MKLPAFEPQVDWKPPHLADLPSWAGAKRVAVDVETCDPDLKPMGVGVRRGGYMTAISFAIEGGPSEFLPIRFEGGGNVDERQVLLYMREQARVFRGDLVGANLPYDLDYLAERDVKFNPRFFRDIGVAEPLLNELADSFKLDDILKRRGFDGKAEEGVQAAYDYFGLDKAMMWRLPAKHVAVYGKGDVTEPLKLLRRQERLLEKEGLWDLYDLESRLLPVLLKMRRRGVRIDFDRLDQVEKWAVAREVEALKEVHRLTGVRLTTDDTTKSAALAPCLEEIGIKVPKTPKTKQPSVNNDLLKGIDHPVAEALLVAKKFNKLRGTFVKSVRKYAVGDRIHCSFHQLRTPRDGDDEDENGTRYGRLSCTHPNLQQQPAQDPEIGPVWRTIYIPDEGGEFAVLDYSQQEPRWTTHYAETSALTGKPRWASEERAAAIAAAEAYRSDPNVDSHDMMSRMVNPSWDDLPKDEKQQERDKAKKTFLGLVYGMGGATLCRKLGFPTKWVPDRYRPGEMREVAGDEGQAFLDEFNRRVPFLKELDQRATSMARRNGYVKTVLGRMCRFPMGDRGRYEWVHKALNRIIQGSSGDQVKKAMVDADDADIRLQLQVHDELDLTIWERETALLLAEIMREAVPCRVPHKLVIKTGPSWGKVKAW